MDMRIVSAGILCSLFTMASFAQNPQVKPGRNIVDSTESAQVSVVSDSFIKPVPVLKVGCALQNNQPAIRIVLVSGPLKPHLGTGFNPVNEWRLRMKLDEGKPIRRTWLPTKQSDSYLYEGRQGAYGYRTPRQFLEDLFAAKILRIQIQRFGEPGTYEASFDVSHLKEALEDRPECADK